MKFFKSKTTIAFLIGLILIISLNLLEKYTSYRFLFFNITTWLLTLIYVALFLIFVSVFLIKKSHIIIKFIIPILALLLANFLFVLFLFTHPGTYFTFSSPDNSYSFVAREWSFLLGGECEIYERVNPFFIKSKEEYLSLDDGYTAISNGKYSITWDENRVTMSVYGYGGEDEVTFILD